MANPVVVSSAATNYAAATSISVALPSSLVVGNLIIIAFSTRHGTNASILSINNPNDDIAWRFVAVTTGVSYAYKPVTGTESGPITVNWSSNSASCAFAIQISGTLSGGVLWGIDAVVGTTSTGGSINTGTPTAKDDSDLMVSVFQVAAAGATWTLPVGWTSNLGDVSGNGSTMNAGWINLSAAGATSNYTATCTSSTTNTVVTFLIREPAFSYQIIDPYNRTTYANAGLVGLAGALGAIDVHAGVSQYWGYYKVAGHTRQAGTLDPLYRSVMLMDKHGKRVIRGAMSVNADGSYSFTHVAAGEYIVMGVDQNNVQNAVVCARITAVAM